MITQEQYWEILRLHNQDRLSSTVIAGKTGIPARTVRKWMNGNRPYPAKGQKGKPSSSAAQPYREKILFWLHETPELTAVQIHQKLSSAGIRIGYRSVVRWLRKNRPPKPRAASMKLSFEPGEAAEIDFGAGPVIAFGNTFRRVSFCAVVLCHSKMLYAEFIPCERVEHFISVQQHAFEYWGGVPHRMIVDNCKCAVIEHIPGKVTYNPVFLDFCGHYGVKPTACRPLHPASKGGVEKSVSYIKHNFLTGRTFLNLEQANAALRVWLDGTANARIHRTTEKRPADMLLEEKEFLLGLPELRYDCSRTETRVVDTFGRITFDHNSYSVPEKLLGRIVTVKASPDELNIYDGTALVATHRRSYDRKEDFLIPEHQDIARRSAAAAMLQNLRSDFLRLGGRSDEFLRRLERSCIQPREQLAKLLALGEMYGRKELAEAIRIAVGYDTCRAEYVEHILFNHAHRPPEMRGVLHVPKANGQMEVRLSEPDIGHFMPKKEADL